jgi:hypothetical protein
VRVQFEALGLALLSLPLEQALVRKEHLSARS